jgi:hypothetical protein
MPTRLNALSGTAALAIFAVAGAGLGAFAQTPPIAPPAVTGASGLAAEIERDSSCAAVNPVGEVRRHLLMASSMSAADIGRALALVVASPTACAQIKAAAMTLADAYPQPNGAAQAAAADPLPPPPAAAPAPAQAQAEPDLKFVVGPPPSRLTKGRHAGG